MKKIIFILLSVAFFFTGNAQLYTRYAKAGNIDSLIQELFASPNVQINNVTYTGYYFPSTGLNGNINDIGYFNSLNSSVGIDSGLALTGGMLAPFYGLGQPASVNASFMKATPGDPDLDNLIRFPNVTTQGAAIVEFDFIPNGDSIKFEYVFASDEYPNQICTEDEDLFAFFISGPGISGTKNIALVPGTNYPVGNSSINDVVTFSLTPNLANCYSTSFPQLYVDHSSDTNFIFNGSTTVLTATHKTIPCQTYHLKLAIAECGGLSDNSIVFIKGNSFNSEPIKIIPKISYSNGDTTLYEGCVNAKIIIRRTYNIQSPKTYILNYSGSATVGVDILNLPNSITMAAGQMYDTLFLYPIADNIPDNFETLIISIGDTLCNGNFYESKLKLQILEKGALTASISSMQKNSCDTVHLKVNIENELNPVKIKWFNNYSDSIINYFPAFATSTYSMTVPISVNIIDECGSIANDTISILFAKYPIANVLVSSTPTNILNPYVSFTNTTQGLNSTYFDFGDGTSSCNSYVTHFYPSPGKFPYSLIVTNEFGCSDTITDTIIVEDISSIYIPNSFTPNNDGLNDNFKPVILNYNKANLQIFDRWGTMIFSTEDIDFGWDGKVRGANTSDDIFLYKITVDYAKDTQKEYTGHLSLIR